MNSLQSTKTWSPVQQRPAGHSVSLAQRVFRQGLYETVNMLRNGEQLLVSIIIPVMVLIGVHTAGLLDTEEHSTLQILTPGVLAIAVMSSAFTSQGIGTAFDRRYGVLRFLSTTPIGNTGLIFGKAIAVMLILLIQLVVLLTVAFVLGYRPELGGILPGLVFLLIGAVAFTSLGLLVAGTLRPEATLAITNLLWILLGAAGGSVFPLSQTGFLTPLLQWLPSAALGDGLRAALMDGQWALLPLLILSAWAAGATALTVKFFSWK
ncbi:ABC transporter permease [Micrococcoides hystricis]|uniref:ABC transporter permease n=1 Tax=Micrococcoides hystricis TaxID=1572761 RepID=A0ABV6P748_9MICC